jgi:two-component system nitrogen regulation response regulator GlnG
MRALRVWHIDDEDVFRRLFQVFCRRRQLPVTIESFDNAYDAVDAIGELDESSLPDIIVLDLRMPGFDGFEFLRALPDANPEHPVYVLVLSSSTDVHDVIEAHELGASSYFSKNEVDELLNHIQSLCAADYPVMAASQQAS